MQGLDTTYEWVVLILISITLALAILGRLGK